MTTNGSAAGPAQGERQMRPPTFGRRCGRAYGGVRERHGTSRYGRLGIF